MILLTEIEESGACPNPVGAGGDRGRFISLEITLFFFFSFPADARRYNIADFRTFFLNSECFQQKGVEQSLPEPIVGGRGQRQTEDRGFPAEFAI